MGFSYSRFRFFYPVAVASAHNASNVVDTAYEAFLLLISVCVFQGFTYLTTFIE